MIPEEMITFAGSYLDRADRLRGNDAALARMRADPATRVLPFWQGRPLFDEGDGPRLAWLRADDPQIAATPDLWVFLGLNAQGTGHFAADLSHLALPGAGASGFDDDGGLTWGPGRRFVEMRAVMAEMTHEDAGIAAAAKGIFEWRRSHRFCANCGAATVSAHAGWRLDCPACGRTHFPRTDPVVIMLVLDGDRVLLGRHPSWPARMFSLLAGFVEPGESIEEAVRRETLEEAGITVGAVRYVTSQPWPFPASLMIGCVGAAAGSDITIDPTELETAIWVSRADMARALAGTHPDIAPARRGAVAQAILRAWVDGLVPGF